jgi:hypothetical protein
MIVENLISILKVKFQHLNLGKGRQDLRQIFRFCRKKIIMDIPKKAFIFQKN